MQPYIKLNHQTYDSMTYHLLSIKNIEHYAFLNYIHPSKKGKNELTNYVFTAVNYNQYIKQTRCKTLRNNHGVK